MVIAVSPDFLKKNMMMTAAINTTATAKMTISFLFGFFPDVTSSDTNDLRVYINTHIHYT